jgi:dimethylsulfoniopropionate demethylase
MSSPVLVLSPRIRSTPYSAQVEALGVKACTVYNHMVLPSLFRSLEEDYWHLREHVQLWDVACERQVELRGPDAARLVQLMTPRDLARVKVGQCAYAPLVDEHGGLVNDPVVLKLAEDHFWLSIASSDVLLWAKGLAAGLKLDVALGEPDVSPLAVQGPKAEELMVRVFGDAVRGIGFFRFTPLDFQGRPLIVARSGWSKQGGFEIYLDDSHLGGALWDALWDAGQDLEVGPGCPNLIERIEGGLLSYGSDMTLANDPFECGLERYCRLDGAEFLGRQALLRPSEIGPQRQIRGLKIAGGPLPGCRVRWRVEQEGSFAGEVSSAAWSPRLGTGIALAMIEKDHWRPGTKLTVALPDGTRRDAEVCALPFAEA